ncbi:hypothetical protein G8A07_21185 [Roseateles sp. DAIF2]|uniref:hypothetical protein n=1 Tax=Roseateles sp. DAIF2 TaxID=2714952 RepID=UPI0018A2E8D5|nr:hypothetical protein [Roseateles sp. DAIF2]QPF75181.1 hypothetical protein G8A07_21185 [Roseateles sp. DAIF2]
MIQRLALLTLSTAAALLTSACVITPHSSSAQPSDVAKLSEQALATCGAGQVKEVNAKSFTCK